MPNQSTPFEGIVRQCAHCQTQFTPTTPAQKCCSDACRTAARRAYHNGYMRHLRNAKKNATVVTRQYRNRVTIICETCGTTKSKPASQAKAAHQYCSTACRNEGQERPVDLVCRWCEAPFRRPLSLAHQQFCDNSCRAQYRFNRDPLGRATKGAIRSGPLLNGVQCLLRTRNIMKGGYSGITWQNKPLGAHVFVWLLTNGPVPDGMEVSHLCHTPNCIEIDHLTVETHEENMQRSVRDGRFGKKVTS